MTLDGIVSILKENNCFAIFPHISLDGDGLGSSLALALALNKLNKKAVVYVEENIPYIYDFLPGKQHIKKYNSYDALAEFAHSVSVAIDTGDIERLGERELIFNSVEITVNIDHHETNSEYALFNYVQRHSSAAGEIVYSIIKMMGIEFDLDISTCLYVAIATDTGGFRFSNTTSLTHKIIADLIDKGIDVSDISKKVFEVTSLARVRLTGMIINSMRMIQNGKTAFMSITLDMIKDAGASEEDCEGMVNIGRNIPGVEVSVVLRQTSNAKVKANLRSNRYVDVARIAKRYSGGGHIRAAGFTADGAMEDIEFNLLLDIEKELSNSMEF